MHRGAHPEARLGRGARLRGEAVSCSQGQGQSRCHPGHGAASGVEGLYLGGWHHQALQWSCG